MWFLVYLINSIITETDIFYVKNLSHEHTRIDIKNYTWSERQEFFRTHSGRLEEEGIDHNIRKPLTHTLQIQANCIYHSSIMEEYKLTHGFTKNMLKTNVPLIFNNVSIIVKLLEPIHVF